MRFSSFLRKNLTVSDKYRLIETPCPSPSLISSNTFCKCDFPPDKQIDHSKPLYGTKALQWKHALILTNTKPTEWSSKIELMPTELVSTMAKYKRSIIDMMYPVLVSNVYLESSNVSKDDKTTPVLVYPDNAIHHVSESSAKSFMREILTPGKEDDRVEFVNPIRNRNPLVLICGHTQRDIRCGMIAPLLKEEFEFNLQKRNLLYDPVENPDGVKVGIISHIGGHAYAGNVLIFDEDGLSIWYGRVDSSLVDGIVEETLVNKNILKDLYRGRY